MMSNSSKQSVKLSYEIVSQNDIAHPSYYHQLESRICRVLSNIWIYKSYINFQESINRL